MNIRKEIEKREETFLSKFAQLSKNSRGRIKKEDECSIRTCFMKDRDRIIHSKAFRRLKHKTQVFFAPKGDHYRTRLTHTLEVSQISRTIARALNLNEDLTEAISLGHDLGHTPFGHIGEKALTMTGRLKTPFNHNEQSLRIVELLEYKGKGLNLSFEVKDGILNHTGSVDPVTYEGKIVKIADRIAYVNHDIDDAIRAKIIKLEDLPPGPIGSLGKHPSQRINSLVKDMIVTSELEGDIKLSQEAGNALLALRTFMFKNVYHDSPAKSENEKAIFLITGLFDYFFKNPEKMAPEYAGMSEDDLGQSVCDFISGMSDRYALDTYKSLFLPSAWEE